MLRRIVSLVVVLLVLVSVLAACGDDDKGSLIGNSETKKFHFSSCSHLPDTSNRVSLADCDAASSGGYSPCGHCNPCGGKSITAP